MASGKPITAINRIQKRRFAFQTSDDWARSAHMAQPAAGQRCQIIIRYRKRPRGDRIGRRGSRRDGRISAEYEEQEASPFECNGPFAYRGRPVSLLHEMDAPMVEHELKTDKTMVAEHDEACTAEVATWMQDGVVAYMAAFVLAWFLLFCGRRRALHDRLIFVRRWFAGFLQFTATISAAVNAHSYATSLETTKTHTGTDAFADGPKSDDWTPSRRPLLLSNRADDTQVTGAKANAVRTSMTDQESKRDLTPDSLSLKYTSSVIAEMEGPMVDDLSEKTISDVESNNSKPVLQVGTVRQQPSVDSNTDPGVVLSDTQNAKSSAKDPSDRIASTDVIRREHGYISRRTPLEEDVQTDADSGDRQRQVQVPEGNVPVLRSLVHPVVDTTILDNYSTESVLFDAVAYITQEREQGEDGTGAGAGESASAEEMISASTITATDLDVEMTNSDGTLDDIAESAAQTDDKAPPESGSDRGKQDVTELQKSPSLSYRLKKQSLLSKDIASTILPCIIEHDPKSTENELLLATDLRKKSVANEVTVETAAATYQRPEGNRPSETAAQRAAPSSSPHDPDSIRPPAGHRKQDVATLKGSLLLLLSQKTVDHEDLAEIVHALARSHALKHDTNAQAQILSLLCGVWRLRYSSDSLVQRLRKTLFSAFLVNHVNILLHVNGETHVCYSSVTIHSQNFKNKNGERSIAQFVTSSEKELRLEHVSPSREVRVHLPQILTSIDFSKMSIPDRIEFLAVDLPLTLWNGPLATVMGALSYRASPFIQMAQGLIPEALFDLIRSRSQQQLQIAYVDHEMCLCTCDQSDSVYIFEKQTTDA